MFAHMVPLPWKSIKKQTPLKVKGALNLVSWARAWTVEEQGTSLAPGAPSWKPPEGER